MSVLGFAGVLRNDDEEQLLGHAVAFSELPKRAVRRLTNLERGVVSCLQGLSASQPDGLGDTACVLASRYGPMQHTLSLLESLTAGDLLSPTAFSLSVHNAALGAASQISKNHGGHTAISAGDETLSAGLTECWVRIQNGADAVVLVYSDLRLPGAYQVFEGETADVQFACILQAEADKPSSEPVGAPAGSARAMAEALASGAGRVTWKI